LAWKSKALDSLGRKIADYRYGVWLVILLKMMIAIPVMLVFGASRGKELPLGQGLSALGLVVSLLLLVVVLHFRNSFRVGRLAARDQPRLPQKKITFSRSPRSQSPLYPVVGKLGRNVSISFKELGYGKSR
jgi:hypothetical protein